MSGQLWRGQVSLPDLANITLEETMSEMAKPLILADMSWPEVRAIQDKIDMVLIPVGSNEQHGPNLALSMDIKGSTHFANAVSAKANPRFLVAPSMPWGVSYHHMNFPGTITLSSATFIQTLVEVVDSLMQHGFTRFFIVNGHGGNQAPLGDALVRIHEELAPDFIGSGLYIHFSDRSIDKAFGVTNIVGHACERETSVAMHFMPEIVKQNALAKGELTDLTLGIREKMKAYHVTVPYRFDRYTTNGALGDARDASAAYGKALMDNAVANFIGLMEDIMKEAPMTTPFRPD